jgi:DNA-binding NarL/FixJ family response regulator
MNRVRLLIADDHVMFAQGLESLLRDEFDLLGTAENGEELVEATLRLNPDVVLVDISMPLLNGFDAVRRIRASGNETRIIFLTMHDDATLVSEAFHCGASGYILKQSAGEELVNAIREGTTTSRHW